MSGVFFSWYLGTTSTGSASHLNSVVSFGLVKASVFVLGTVFAVSCCLYCSTWLWNQPSCFTGKLGQICFDQILYSCLDNGKFFCIKLQLYSEHSAKIFYVL